MKFKNNLFISVLVLFLVMIISTIILYVMRNKEEIHYEIVNSTVLSADKEVKMFMGHQYFKTTVFVSYEGTKHQLIGAERNYHSYTYPPNKVVEVYLNNGKLYADQNAIRNDLIISKIYFLFLILSGIVGIILLISIIYYRKELKKIKVKN